MNHLRWVLGETESEHDISCFSCFHSSNVCTCWLTARNKMNNQPTTSTRSLESFTRGEILSCSSAYSKRVGFFLGKLRTDLIEFSGLSHHLLMGMWESWYGGAMWTCQVLWCLDVILYRVKANSVLPEEECMIVYFFLKFCVLGFLQGGINQRASICEFLNR